MKKLYSIFAVAVISVSAFAQGSETFTKLNASGTGYTDGSYTGDNGVTWTFKSARKATGSDAITGTSIGFDQSGTRSVSAQSGAEGVGSLTYSVKSYFTGGIATDRSVEVYINNVLQETFKLAAMNTTYKRTVTPNVAGDVLIEFRSVGTRQLVIDDVSWTKNGVLGVANVDNAKKSTLVKNSIADNELFFSATSSVKIFNANGQLVKTADVAENSSVNISGLAKGIYVVTGEVNGKMVSEKIMKK